VPSWETYVRRLHDTEDVRIFVTGSSSSLLTRERFTRLRGRSISYELFPLSFAELLAFRGIKHQPYSRASESRHDDGFGYAPRLGSDGPSGRLSGQPLGGHYGLSIPSAWSNWVQTN
jgi:predicted AAA+ superfamily ATPase